MSSALQVGKLLAACNLLLSNMLELSQGSLPPPPAGTGAARHLLLSIALHVHRHRRNADSILIQF